MKTQSELAAVVATDIAQKVVDRFWAKVKRGEGADSCWEWDAGTDRDGYGVFSFRGEWIYAHRFAHVAFCDPVPAGLLVCHHCDNPKCVRPDHLFLGTHGDNHADRGRKHRQARGAKCHTTKLNPAKVLAIRAGHGAGQSQRQLAAVFGVARNSIRCILSGKSWSHV